MAHTLRNTIIKKKEKSIYPVRKHHYDTVECKSNCRMRGTTYAMTVCLQVCLTPDSWDWQQNF